MNDCIFCKIVKGEIPSAKVHEDETMCAFLDINPINPGHTLIIPKRHMENLHDMHEEEIQHAFGLISKIAKAIVVGVQADGFNIGMNNGKAAGQVVMHAHIHIIPRFANDGFHHWQGKPYEDGQRDEVARRIKNNLA